MKKDRQYFKQRVKGIISSIKTPFLENGDIDYEGLGNFIEASIAGGASTILLTPGDSLYCVLSDEEVLNVTEFCIETVNQRCVFLGAAKPWWTKQTAEYVDFACEKGADAVLVAPPARGMTVSHLIEYYKNVSKNAPVYILSAGLQYVGLPGALKAVANLLEEAPNVVGFKEDYTPRFAQSACMLAKGRWSIFAGGAKQTHMDMHAYGCDGYMSVFVTYKPEVSHAYWQAIEKNDLTKAVDVIKTYDMPLFQHIASYAAGGDAALHGLLEIAGVASRWRRAPLPSMSDADMQTLRSFLNEHDMLVT